MKRARTGFLVAIFSLLVSPSVIVPLVPLSVNGAYGDGASTLRSSTIYLDSVSRNTGTDCMEGQGPQLTAPPDRYRVNVDPATKRNERIELRWNKLCSANTYELQISGGAAFTKLIAPSVNGQPPTLSDTGTILLNIDSDHAVNPSVYIAAGALPEAGAIYWWRVRASKLNTGQIERSLWSTPRYFIVKAASFIGASWYGVVLISPNNGSKGCTVDNISFSWSPWNNASKYQFDLARDSEFKQIVVTAMPASTSYKYGGVLEYNTTYYWRVKTLEVTGTDISTTNDWSDTFSFTTQEPPPPPPATPVEPTIPIWLWIIIALGTLLIVAAIILIVRKAHHRQPK
jgi:hypothetical protein